MNLAGKRVIITAASSGIGRAGVRIFSGQGAFVAAIDMDQAALDATVAETEKSGGRAFGVRADLTDRTQCRVAIEEAIKRLGGIDVLWLNAGVTVLADLAELDLAQYDNATELNLTGTVISIGAALPHFRKQRTGGSIILTASISGLVGSTQAPIYSMHKFGTVGLTKSLALALGPEGIRVNVVCPGHTRTAALLDFLNKRGSDSVSIDTLAKQNCLGRLGEPEDMANAAAWLASEQASFVTGVAIPVDGGYTAK